MVMRERERTCLHVRLMTSSKVFIGETVFHLSKWECRKHSHPWQLRVYHTSNWSPSNQGANARATTSSPCSPTLQSGVNIVFHDRCKNGINDVISLFFRHHITEGISTSTTNPLLAQSEHALQSYYHGKIQMFQNECLIYAKHTPIVSFERDVADWQIWVRWRAYAKNKRCGE